MPSYVVRRVLGAVVVFLALTLATYIIFFVLPLNRTTGTRVLVDNTNRRPLTLEGPIWQAYVHFLGHIVHGSLGNSFVSRQDVSATLIAAAPVTLSVVIGGAVVCLLVAVPVGVLSALRPRSLLDRAATIAVLVGVSAHPVWIGFVLSYLLGFRWHVLPIGGYCSFSVSSAGCSGPAQWAYHLLLPWATFGILFAALYMRMVRTSVLEVLDDDYVRTARAKGAPEHRVLRAHVLRCALLPVVTMLGMDIGLAFGGSVFVETVFGLPGLGQIAVHSLRVQDLPMLAGVVVWTTTAILVLNLLVDLLYVQIDPRIRFSSVEQPERPHAWRPRPRANFGSLSFVYSRKE
ncbi:MAG TPA: ABC transporter permease [Gaiellaceae bacterium]|nr:ABC transporter permease [Gaiellaceae bacterium]